MTTTVDTRLCVATHPHETTATGDLFVCLGHQRLTHTLIAELPGLYIAMLQPTRLRFGSRVTGSTERRIPITDDMVTDRATLAAKTAGWVTNIARWRDITPPDGTIRKQAGFLDRHADFVLTFPDEAERLVDDLKTITSSARRTAYPARSDRIFIGTCNNDTDDGVCGGRLHAAPTDDTVTCPDCGEWGTIGWWHARLVPATDGPLNVPQLVTHMLMRYGLVLTTEQIWKWKERGKLTPAGRDDRGRPLYDPLAVAAIANHRRG